MKLIDLLVRELPKCGGWPCGVKCMVQSVIDGEIYAYNRPYDGRGCMEKYKRKYMLIKSDDTSLSQHNGLYPVITRTQYEAALAASKKVEWVDGLPPVGCECEWQDKNTKQWQPVTVVYASEWVTVVREINKEKGDDLVEVAIENYGDESRSKFRPLRTEAERKRDYVISALTNYTLRGDACDIYNAIAAGKIPGVKLEG